MLQNILKNHHCRDVLWIGGRFEEYQSVLQQITDHCSNVLSSFQAISLLELQQNTKRTCPIILIESNVTQLDRHWLTRVVTQIKAYGDAKIIHLGQLNNSHNKDYFKVVNKISELFGSLDIIVSPVPNSPNTALDKSLEHQHILMVENNSTRRLIARGLLNSLKINHQICDYLSADFDVSPFDICFVSHELLDEPEVKSALAKARRVIALGGNTAFETLATPLREQNLLNVFKPNLSVVETKQSIPEVANKQRVKADFKFDLDEIKARLGVSQDIVELVINTYSKDLAAQIFRLENAIESAEPDQIRSASHLVKGSSATVGLDELSAFAASIEKLAAADVSLGSLSDDTSLQACDLLRNLKQFEESLDSSLADEVSRNE